MTIPRPVDRRLVRQAVQKLEAEGQIPGPRNRKNEQLLTDAYNLLMKALEE